MKSNISQNHKSDEQGRPAGGSTHGRGFTIAWQDGPLKELPVGAELPNVRVPNGAFVEDIIQAAIGRLKFDEEVFGGVFSCQENEDAIHFLERAAVCLDARTKRREAAGTERTHQGS